MLIKTFRISLFGGFLLLLTWGLYGQFSSKCSHLTIKNSVLQSDSDKKYSQADASDFFGTDDFDLLDDDDNFDSPVKKISSEDIACFDLTQYSLHHFPDTDVQSKFCCTKSYHMPDSRFISLRVFRL